jgi:hypothetical protein
MTLPPSGNPLSLSQIYAEIYGSHSTQQASLRSMSSAASKDIPDAVSEFYNYDHSPATLSVSPTSLSINWLGHPQSVSITATPSSLTWSTTISPPAAGDWLSRSPISGTGSGSMSISASQNTGPPRIGTVDITASGVSGVVTVTANQAGGQV